MAEKSLGKVYLIGAGPGDPGLLTVKGRDLLASADVVVYDRLASERLLSIARRDAEFVYVGKESSRHAMTQDEINAVLAEKALEGKSVARLKGGDPFVFGRGGEEAEYVRRFGIFFEIVPGVTSAIAGPAYAGIPVTHRGVASSVAFVTGHEDPKKETTAINWRHLATATDTIVFLMGMENLGKIVEQLVANGRPDTTPVGLVRWGTTVEQETLVGTLADIEGRAAAEQFKSPALIVVGEVVSLRPTLKWFEDKPLFGKRVVVTRSRAQASKLVDRLFDLGAEALEFPTIETVPPEDFSELDGALRNLPGFDWLVLTSANGVSAVWERLAALNLDARALAGVKVAAIGSETARALAQRGIRADIVPDEYKAEGLLESFPEAMQGQRVLLARAKEARDVLPRGLAERGAQVTEIVAYRTVTGSGRAADLARLLREGRVHAVTFTSSSTVNNFVDLLSKELASGESVTGLLAGVLIACIGPITAQTAAGHGLKVDVQAKEYTIDGLVEAISTQFVNGSN
jgi:uroporphyrinogen III methyltransferase/synthase